MSAEVLDELLAMIKASSHSAGSLVLFALVKTLSAQQGQYLFLLNKFRDLDADQRKLGYRIIEAMVAGENATADWAARVAAIEDAIRRG